MELRTKMERKDKRSLWYFRLLNMFILAVAVLIFVATVWNFEGVMKWVYGMMAL